MIRSKSETILLPPQAFFGAITRDYQSDNKEHVCSERTLNSNAYGCSIMVRSCSLDLVVTRIYVRSVVQKNLEFSVESRLGQEQNLSITEV